MIRVNYPAVFWRRVLTFLSVPPTAFCAACGLPIWLDLTDRQRMREHRRVNDGPFMVCWQSAVDPGRIGAEGSICRSEEVSLYVE